MKPYKEMNLIQGTPEWHAFRSEHIMATCSAKIAGKNPWTTAIDCYEEKVEGKKTFVTPAMQRGILLEHKARELLIKLHGVHLDPKVVESIENPVQGASLDAVNLKAKVMYEIKCVGEKTMKKALNEVVDAMYIIQCQKQMYVTGFDTMGIFFYFNDFLYKGIQIDRNDKLIKDLLKSDMKFWNENILKKIKPEKYGEEYNRINETGANLIAEAYIEILAQEKKLKEQKETLTKKLERYTNKESCIFTIAGLRHQIIKRKGSVDWKGVANKCEISNDTLDSFRKEATEFSKFSEM